MVVRVRFPGLPGRPWMDAAAGATWTHLARGGPDEATWSQVGTTTLRLPVGEWAELWDGGTLKWWGKVGEQSDHTAGTWHGVGLSRTLDKTPAIHSDSDMRPTSILTPILTRLATAGVITGSEGPEISAWAGVHVVDQPLGTTVGEVLDRAMADVGGRWWVDEHRRVRWELLDDIPVSAWVRLREVRWGITTQEYVNAVYVAYRNADATVYAVVRDTSPDTAIVADRWGTLDLTGRGNLTPEQAENAARKRLTRPALTDAMTLSSVNTTTPGQVPLPGRCLIAGQKVRVWATAGMDSVAGPWHDTILQATRHTAATSTIEADPDGRPARGIHAMATWARGRYADPLKIRKR